MRLRTWVIGHRGASSEAPENTLAAFDRAFTLGADGIELDTQLSADGVPVVIHDSFLDRTTGIPGAVQNSTLAEMKKLDAGRWFDAKFSGERIPTLAEALDLSRNRGFVNVEVKSSNRADVAKLTGAVLRVIDAWTHAEQVLISSFDPRVIRQVRRHSPALRTAFLRSYRQRLPLGALAWWSGADFLDVDAPLAARAAQLRGIDRVLVWTVDQSTEQQRLAAEGVRGIITNRVAETIANLEGLRTRRTGVLL